MAIKVLVELIDKSTELNSTEYLYRIITNKDIEQLRLETEIIKAIAKLTKR
jgi:hypothetical protein